MVIEQDQSCIDIAVSCASYAIAVEWEKGSIKTYTVVSGTWHLDFENIFGGTIFNVG